MISDDTRGSIERSLIIADMITKAKRLHDDYQSLANSRFNQDQSAVQTAAWNKSSLAREIVEKLVKLMGE